MPTIQKLGPKQLDWRNNKKIQFLVALVIWYDLFFQMNMISKLMQSKDIQFDIAHECIKSATEVMKKYKENGFTSAQISA